MEVFMNKYNLAFLKITLCTLFLSIEASLVSTNEKSDSIATQHSYDEHPIETQLKKTVEFIQKSTTIAKPQKMRFQYLFVQCMLDIKLYIHSINLIHPSEIKMRVPKVIELSILSMQTMTSHDDDTSDQSKLSHADINDAIKINAMRKECMHMFKQHPFLLYNHKKLTNYFEYIKNTLKNKNELRFFEQVDYYILKQLFHPCTYSSSSTSSFLQ